MSLMDFVGIKKTLEDFVKSNKEGVQYKKIEFESIVFSAFVQLKCMNCGMFRRNYHCLAVPRWRKAKETLSKYDNYYLIYTQFDNRPRIKDYFKKAEESKKQGKRVMNDWLIHRNACGANQVIVYNKIRRFLIDVKRMYPKEKLKLFGAGGGCHTCRVCGLIKPHKTGEPRTPCSRPNESFGAPESIGIDVYATLKKNNIKYDIIPKYLITNVGLICQKIITN